MPRTPAKPCTWPEGCTELCTTGSRCATHAPPAWQGSTRRARLPKDWPTIRARILERDGHRCTKITDGQRCANEATDVDHIINGDDHSDANLHALCDPHHRAKTASEGGQASARARR